MGASGMALGSWALTGGLNLMWLRGQGDGGGHQRSMIDERSRPFERVKDKNVGEEIE